jgi:hypothetical protein
MKPTKTKRGRPRKTHYLKRVHNWKAVVEEALVIFDKYPKAQRVVGDSYAVYDHKIHHVVERI